MPSPLRLLRRAGITQLVSLFVVALVATNVFAALSSDVIMIDLPTNGSYIIETQPPPDVYATIRVAGPPPGRSWRVTIAANCSFIEGPWARGFSGTTAADSPGSFQAIIHSPFNASRDDYFFQILSFLDATSNLAPFPIEVSITYHEINLNVPEFPAGRVMTVPVNGNLGSPLTLASWIPGNPPFFGVHSRLLSGVASEAIVSHYVSDPVNLLSAPRRGIPHFLILPSSARTQMTYNDDLLIYSRAESVTETTAPGILNVEAIADLPVLIAVSNPFGSVTNTNITLTFTNTTAIEGPVFLNVIRPRSGRFDFSTRNAPNISPVLNTQTVIFPRSSRFGSYYYLRLQYSPPSATAASLAAMTQRVGLRLECAVALTTMVPLSVGQTLSGPALTLFNFSADAAAARAGQYMLTVSSSVQWAVAPLTAADYLTVSLEGFTAWSFTPNTNFTTFPACLPPSSLHEVIRIEQAGSVTLYREDPPTLTYPSSFITNDFGIGTFLFKPPTNAPYPVKVIATAIAGDLGGGDLWYSGPFNSSICPSTYAPACYDTCSFYVACPDEFILMKRSRAASIRYNITIEAATIATVNVSASGQLEFNVAQIDSTLLNLQVNDSTSPVTLTSDPSVFFRVRSASACNRPSFANNVHAPVSSGMLIEVASHVPSPTYINLSPFTSTFSEPPAGCERDVAKVYPQCRSRLTPPFIIGTNSVNQKLENAFYSLSITYSSINTTMCYQFILNETCIESYRPCFGEPACYETCMNRAYDAGCSVTIGSAVCQVLDPCRLPDAPVPSPTVVKYFLPAPMAPPVAAPTAPAPSASPVASSTPQSAPVDAPVLSNPAPVAPKTPTVTTVNSSPIAAVSLFGLILGLLCSIAL